MICTVKQPAISIRASDVLLRKGSTLASAKSCSLVVPSSHPREKTVRSLLSVQKPLHLSCVGLGNFVRSSVRRERGDLGTCKAYEAERPEVEGADPSEAAKKVKIGIYFATWWALNVVFNIYNKKVLNAYPYPWLTSTLSLACGSLMMLISWATRIAEPPKTDLEFWKTLLPVAVAHTIGHVAATVSMSKVAVSFTHIIKSGEPAFSVLVSRFLLGETFPVPVYLSLIPIIGGCALAAVTELNFNMIGFMGAMISNLAFVFRNIFSKKGMKGKAVSGMNYYACLSMLSLVILTPFAIAVEGPQMWAIGWQAALSQIGPQFIWWVAAQSIFYHLYNQVSYMSLDEISPLTFSIGNTMKRISVIVSSIIIFHTPVQPVNALGAAIAILGTFLYSQCNCETATCYSVLELDLGIASLKIKKEEAAM
ncbi:Glucose-6-phosphate/phosphate translocator [Vigna angularis]|uniref:Glucose-6-phosphate/phosphate translocator n=1 Tax=Phaseolus angularis TaxID=3914 RepID=A0A8T0K2B9_PHAAN|nr:Glucose-6-phosphate/phosphate translocator [Vigna angularis]